MARGRKQQVRSNRYASSLQNPSTPSSDEAGTSVGEGGEVAIVATASESEVAQSGTKRNSLVWDHFKEYEKVERVKDVERNIIEIVHKRAHCIHCPQGKIGDFYDVIDMENNKNSLFVDPEMATGSETEKVLQDMAANMRHRWMKYFGSFGDLNNMLIIGLILDARFKLKNVTHMYAEEGLDVDEVERRTNAIKDLLMALYDEYVVHVDGGIHMQRPHSSISSSSTVTSTTSTSKGHRGQRLSNWKKVVQETEEAFAAHEVDQYLDAALDPTYEEDHFDILCWWKINGCKFPVLAVIARDVLAIQTSTVACFSTEGRVIDCFRSSLTPKSVEGLIYMQNWMLGDDCIC
ncbi:hypothetical protein OROHE_007468 [Orobanche hederae]